VKFRSAELHPLMALGAIFAVLSGAFVSIFFVRFHPSIWVIPAHVLLALGLLAGSLLTAAALRSVCNTGQWTTLLPVIVVGVGLCALYLVNAFAWVFWIDSVSLKLIAFYAAQIGRFHSGELGLTAWLLLAPLCAGIAVLIFAFFRAAPSLYVAVSRAAAPRSRPILVLLTAYCSLYSIVFSVGIRQVPGQLSIAQYVLFRNRRL
jgi:hypothetical protein